MAVMSLPGCQLFRGAADPGLPAPRGERRVASDTRLGAYKNIDGHAIPTEITVYRAGKPVFREIYADVRVNVPFSPALFEPARWKNAPHPDAR